MGSIGGMVGLAGGASGSGFSGPGFADLQYTVSDKQAADAYKANQNALGQQQNFLNAVQAQNGLGNQTSVYNQLQGVANGTGPNPAQAMLANSTGQNVANQAALMAGQRGAGSNVGLMARQAAQQGAQTQQGAAGQAAALQAGQSLGALQGMGGLANTQAAQQAAATGAVTQAQQSEQANLLNAIAQQNNARVGMQSNVNNANASLAGTTMQNQANLIGGAMNGGGAASLMGGGGGGGGMGSLIGLAAMAGGGQVQQYADGGVTAPSSIEAPTLDIGSFIGQHVGGKQGQDKQKPAQPTPDQLNNQLAHPTNISPQGQQAGSTPTQFNMDSNTVLAAKGGKVPALVSPGEQYIPPKDLPKVKHGANPLNVGERIPGKPKHPGNDYRNDTVRRNLDSGGVVIPNEIMQSKDAANKAAKFVEAILAKNKLRK